MITSRNRVVVTGMGAVTPLGASVDSFWRGLTEGCSGIGPITLCDASNHPCQIAGEVSVFDPETYINPREARRMARFSQLSVAAAYMALEDADIDIGNINQETVSYTHLTLPTSDLV